jgi:hypothetical protein
MKVSRVSSGSNTAHTFGNPPCLDPSSVSPTNQSSSSGEGPVTRILRIQSDADVSWLGSSTHVSSLAKDRSVACGDLYLRLCLVSDGSGVMDRATPASTADRGGSDG